jgi:Leucine-rich repeat (LRR) protein
MNASLYTILIYFTEIIYLWVNEDGKMNGTLPDSFYNLTKLTDISLSGHAFTGSIKTEIGNMRNLTSLKINRNKFTGTLPSELGLCEKLGKGDIDSSLLMLMAF